MTRWNEAKKTLKIGDYRSNQIGEVPKSFDWLKKNDRSTFQIFKHPVFGLFTMSAFLISWIVIAGWLVTILGLVQFALPFLGCGSHLAAIAPSRCEWSPQGGDLRAMRFAISDRGIQLTENGRFRSGIDRDGIGQWRYFTPLLPHSGTTQQE